MQHSYVFCMSSAECCCVYLVLHLETGSGTKSTKASLPKIDTVNNESKIPAHCFFIFVVIKQMKGGMLLLSYIVLEALKRYVMPMARILTVTSLLTAQLHLRRVLAIRNADDSMGPLEAASGRVARQTAPTAHSLGA